MYTSCYSRVKIISPPLEPVAISRGVPRWFKGRRCEELAPSRAMLDLPLDEFVPLFLKQLARLNAKKLAAELGENAVLLCWEKPGTKCHRRLVADWFLATIGLEVPELSLGTLACFTELPNVLPRRNTTAKALTVLQPFAHLIATGIKRIENRTWPTSYRGPLFIHAGSGRRHLRPAVWQQLAEDYGIKLPDPSELALGAIIAVCELIDCVPVRQVHRQAFAEGPWCFMLDNIRPLGPLPCRGALGLWDPPTEALALLR